MGIEVRTLTSLSARGSSGGVGSSYQLGLKGASSLAISMAVTGLKRDGAFGSPAIIAICGRSSCT